MEWKLLFSNSADVYVVLLYLKVYIASTVMKW
jgi:hypothetical protein